MKYFVIWSLCFNVFISIVLQFLNLNSNKVLINAPVTLFLVKLFCVKKIDTYKLDNTKCSVSNPISLEKQSVSSTKVCQFLMLFVKTSPHSFQIWLLQIFISTFLDISKQNYFHFCMREWRLFIVHGELLFCWVMLAILFIIEDGAEFWYKVNKTGPQTQPSTIPATLL